ncbi:Holliday junction branch migration DNA helicase RuvB [Candidatus Peregrinibacteria bacterium]|nr:Holliday junction branch migration DNA helicase RuvB [Candidatus Peregrinibacteria bacterium]MBT4148255.1 Holliday junction branch migration DNA helicase RuvB [Candidatus Peregrinibacteria bacterium]MBT4366573.1 Holliday junction branch migration DNA helicase RuvB [Candidatus Peregrinibacteria bacterium]MBT4455948.1 Holliday junction branch migration DNA helicase RuvB [Candidatus Peregrinibacteria bacterium]
MVLSRYKPLLICLLLNLRKLRIQKGLDNLFTGLNQINLIVRDDKNPPKPKTPSKALESEERIVSPAEPNANAFENKLRPTTLEEYVGQKKLKENLKISIEASKKRDEPLEHVLLHGPPGLGKTTLASIISREMNVNIKITSGPALEKQGDLAAIISNLNDGDVLFIDEIHRIRSVVEEILYTAMEDYGIDIVLGKGTSASSMRINLPRFTLIGATTKTSLLSSPLRDRFGHNYKLNFYTIDEITSIILRSAKILNTKINPDAAIAIANCARQTPRIANRLLKRVRDFADYHDVSCIDVAMVAKAFNSLGIDDIGLDTTDRKILKDIIVKFGGGPVGLNTISAATSEEESTIEDIYEPFLIKLGMLERTPRGRIATPNAYVHLGLEQKSLL